FREESPGIGVHYRSTHGHAWGRVRAQRGARRRIRRNGGAVNVACPECRSVFRVDPAKIPGAMVRARCAVCGGVITVSRDGAQAADEFTPRATPAVNFGNAPTPVIPFKASPPPPSPRVVVPAPAPPPRPVPQAQAPRP